MHNVTGPVGRLGLALLVMLGGSGCANEMGTAVSPLPGPRPVASTVSTSVPQRTTDAAFLADRFSPAGPARGSEPERAGSRAAQANHDRTRRAPASGGTRTAQVHSCTLYASSSGFGRVCSPAKAGFVETVRHLLRGEQFSRCRKEEPVAGFVAPARPRPGHSWQLLMCVDGIDPVTLTRSAAGTSISFSFVDVTSQEYVTTSRQDDAFSYVAGGRQIPYPILLTSRPPRVASPVSFSLAGKSFAPRYLDFGDVAMRARVVGFDVDSGDGSPVSSCPPPPAVPIETTDDEETRPDGCWHTYERSSAGYSAPDFDDRFPLTATTRWVVEYDAGAGWRLLNSFTKQAYNPLRVTEIQTLVLTR